MARRLVTAARKRAIAARLALVVLALQGAVLLALAMTPGDPPGGARLTLWQLLWASARKPTFYPLVGLLVAGPVLTVVAWRLRGPHRSWLVLGWGAFLAIAVPVYGFRLAVMLRVLWWQYGSGA